MKRVVALLESYCYQQVPRSIPIEEYLAGVYQGTIERQKAFAEMVYPTPVPVEG
jgi:hypothetical protein